MLKDDKQPGPGLGNLLLGYALLGIQPVPVALLAGLGVGAAETVFARFSFGALAIAAVCLARRRGLRTDQPLILLLRGLLGGAAVMLYFLAIQHAGAARGTLLNYTYPVWANLFAAALGARPPRSYWWGLSVALVGVWLVVVPSEGLGEGGLGLGELAGLASAFFAGGAVLTIKQLRKTDESLTIIASFTVSGLLISIPLSSAEGLSTLVGSTALPLAAAVGAIAFLGHVFFTRGYQGVSVAHATLLSLLVPVIASLCGFFLLDEELSWRFAVGAALVLGASTSVVRAAQAPAQSPSSSAT